MHKSKGKCTGICMADRFAPVGPCVCGHLWSNLHAYICYLGKLYYLCHEFRHHSGGVRKFLIEKVLLKLSSKIKFSQSLSAVKMIAVAPHRLVCTAVIGSLHNLWCGLLLYPQQRQCEKPDFRIKQI